MPPTPLAQSLHAVSFETWCANHDDGHLARWCRELYPWEVFARGDYRDAVLTQQQRIGPHFLTVLGKAPGKVPGRTEFRVRLETAGDSQGVTWRNGRWADEFVLVTANDGHFITLFTKRDDPARHALTDFMTGRFDRLDAKRCLPWSALLFRTLVAELAVPLGPWDRYAVFPLEPLSVRADHRQHPEFQPEGHRLSPYLSRGRSSWLMYGFTEEKAHRQALYCEGQCERLLSVYCHPTLTPHHRSRSPATEVVSLFQLARMAGRSGALLPQIRLLTNHMRMVDSEVPFSQTLEEATRALAAATGPQQIATSELREARAALGIEVQAFGDVAYAFASANLLNAATSAKAGHYKGAQELPKEVYSFKQRVGAWVESLIDEPVDGVSLYVGGDGVVYIQVGPIQFSFHAIPRSPRLLDYAASVRNVAQTWSGRRLQPIAPAVLAWGRAAFRSESLGHPEQATT